MTRVWPVLAGVLLLAGCADDELPLTPDAANLDDGTGPEGRQVDVLFVIDNSGGTFEAQRALAASFPALLDRLDRSGERPDLHVGVVTSSLGAGDFRVQSCEQPGGDRGGLQNTPKIRDCRPPRGRFIEDVSGPGGRVRNYDGDMASAFSCIARLGTDGCGFEQHLQSMLKALDGSAPENAGFLRPGALLVVIIQGDEDDCSAHDPELYDPTRLALGAPTSFRCFQFGVRCEPAGLKPSSPGPRTACQSNEASTYVQPVRSYVEFLQRLKGSRRKLVVATIVGTGPVDVGTDGQGNPLLLPSCYASTGAAAPGVRLSEFARSFGFNGFVDSICQDGYGAGLERVADRINQLLPAPAPRIPDGGVD
ncbi:MAG: hypothetical protein IT370_01840 [Deltaproteobacteria bacterium]|nr:hypothetical protein [Deltaproteobacteria bacterium]